VAGRWRQLAQRGFGEAVEPGGPGAGIQLWWQVPPGGAAVRRATGLLEVLQGPQRGRRFAWGLQARVVDASGCHLGLTVASLEVDEAGAWRRASTGPDGKVADDAVAPVGAVELAITPGADGGAAALTDIAVWTEIDRPPDDPPVAARWSTLRCHLAGGTILSVPAVMVTFPTGRQWRRVDVQRDDVGVLQVSNTKRRTPNRTVLTLPADQ
jgi:hypothetical protein